LKLAGYRITCSTILYRESIDEPRPARPEYPSLESLADEEILTLTLDVEGQEQSPFRYWLSIDDARRLDAWLDSACEGASIERAGDLSTIPLAFFARGQGEVIGVHHGSRGDDNPEYLVTRGSDGVRLVFYEDVEAEVIVLSTAKALDLAAGLRRGIAAVHDEPPMALPDYAAGHVTGLTSGGVFKTVHVEVTQGVSAAEQPRLTLCFLGRWTFDETTTTTLVEALDSATAALVDEGGGLSKTFLELPDKGVSGEPFTWLSVRTVTGRGGKPAVRLRLYDELVEDRGEDGVLDLSPGEAHSLARALSEGMRFISTTEPYVFVSPEPFEREICASLWVDGDRPE